MSRLPDEICKKKESFNFPELLPFENFGIEIL